MTHTYFSKEHIQESERVRRLNMINSVSGIKPANLIGTCSLEKKDNLAIFSSVVHLGSNPALFGFILRPTGEVRRDTYENILSTGIYTINAVPEHLIVNAHYTSAKFENAISEFERCDIKKVYRNEFAAPYVMESPIAMGLSFIEEIPIKSNGTRLIVGSVEHLYIADGLINNEGYVNLDQANIVGIGGLNSYYELSHKEDHPYARVVEVPTFN